MKTKKASAFGHRKKKIDREMKVLRLSSSLHFTAPYTIIYAGNSAGIPDGFGDPRVR